VIADAEAPIGAFDSGVGGLAILREIRHQLPAEDLIYVADSGHAPYGDKPAAVVRERAHAICRFLIERGVKAIVVACNTATGIAVDDLRATYPVPIIAIEPAVKPAAARTRSGTIGVLATTGTIASQRFSNLVADYARGADVLAQACPGLAAQVEAGEFNSTTTRAMLERYITPLIAKGADTLVLGCTHYSFLTPLVAELCGPAITIIDPAPAVAAELRRRLATEALLAGPTGRGRETFFTTGSFEQTHTVLSVLWPGRLDLTAVEIPS
jgi:glutamate racemase